MLSKAVVGILTALLVGSVQAEIPVYTIGPKGGIATVLGGDSTRFSWKIVFGTEFTYQMDQHWRLALDFMRYDITDDDEMIAFRATGLGMSVDHSLPPLFADGHLTLGGGGGVLFWKGEDPEEDTVVHKEGANHERRDFAASELFMRIRTALVISLAPRLIMDIGVQADYLTGAGASFSDAVNDARDRVLLNSFISLRYGFGGSAGLPAWRSEPSWTASQTTAPQRSRSTPDSDGDGIADKKDRCRNTPPGALVDRSGCGTDTDGDGVADGLDDCPNTQNEAHGKVDIYGCAFDSDFDGLPDYLDRCPFNRTGAHVDSTGCPVDSDADGIPDGIDDCPNTLFGAEVDKRGCIDLSMLAQPMVLNIDYQPGSYEIDTGNRERLRRLASLLLVVRDIRMDINGYTDNIGTAPKNQQLSEKRARRVRDFLVAQGVHENRFKVYGRGETNFVAPNDTADGRTKNRRVEIVFYR